MDFTPRFRRSHSWVYLLKCGDRYKIGFSASPSSRVRHLQTGAPQRIYVVHVLLTLNYREIEKSLHRKFYDKRRQGEWFALDATDVAYVKSLDRMGCDPTDPDYDPKPPAARLPPEVVQERRAIAIMQGQRHAKLREFFWSWT